MLDNAFISFMSMTLNWPFQFLFLNDIRGNFFSEMFTKLNN